eukprot:443311_1
MHFCWPCKMDSKRKCLIEYWMRLSLKVRTYSTDFIPIVIAYSRGIDDPEDIFDRIALLHEESDANVYKALDRRDGTLVAIKITKSEFRLKKQIEIVKSYESQYLVVLKDVHYKDEYAWIVMEYHEGADVLTFMKATKEKFNEELLQIIMRQMLEGLKYLHARCNIHRGVQSSNILMDVSGDCKLDVSTLFMHGGLGNDGIVEPYWLSPETIKSSEYYDQSDIWSLGITAIEMATGKPPHSTDTNANVFKVLYTIAHAAAPQLPHDQNCSAEFRDFVRLCLIKDHNQRPIAEDLLQHRWIQNAGKRSVLCSWVNQSMPFVEQWRHEQRECIRMKNDVLYAPI